MLRRRAPRRSVRRPKHRCTGGIAVALTGVLLLSACGGSTNFYSWTALGPGDHSNNYDNRVRYGKVDSRDWPVTLIFFGDATVSKVRSALSALGIPTCSGSACDPMYMRLDDGNGPLWDSEQGNKKTIDSGPCFGGGLPGKWITAWHVRFYADQGVSFNAGQGWGNYVIATTHKDIDEGCGDGLARYPEQSEDYFAALFRNNGYQVYPEQVPMFNAEEGNRYNSGSATMIRM